MLARQRLKEAGLTNTSSPTRTFGFNAKATPLIARPNLTRRRGKRIRRRGRFLGGRSLSFKASAKSGEGSEKRGVSDEEEKESSRLYSIRTEVNLTLIDYLNKRPSTNGRISTSHYINRLHLSNIFNNRNIRVDSINFHYSKIIGFF